MFTLSIKNDFKLIIVISLVISLFGLYAPISKAGSTITIDFSTYPGSDGLLGTADDIYVNLGDTVIDQYSSLGVNFTGLNFIDFCCNFDFTLGALAMFGALSVSFDTPQTLVSFDAIANIASAGQAIPVTLKDASGNILSSFNLTNVNANPAYGGDAFLYGHFDISSSVPFSQVELGATLPDGGGFFFDNLNFEAPSQEPVVKEILVDIKPKSYVNKINSDSNGVVPVAILTTPDFNASTISVPTIRFGPALALPIHSAAEDVDNDGDLDMILHFDMRSVGFVCATNNAVNLSGQTLSGELLHGVNSVIDVACK